MIEFCNLYIPLGMCRSVKRDNNNQTQHPVRDASLTGCKRYDIVAFSTERCIPNGIRPKQYGNFEKF
jgi:hypothetical protein